MYDLKKPSISKALTIVWDMSVPEIWDYMIGENKFFPMCAHGIYKYPNFWKDKLEEYSSKEIHDICMSRVKLSLIRNSK